MPLLPAQPPSPLGVGADTSSCVVVRLSLLVTVSLVGQVTARVHFVAFPVLHRESFAEAMLLKFVPPPLPRKICANTTA